jgi:hypothetical protein
MAFKTVLAANRKPSGSFWIDLCSLLPESPISILPPNRSDCIGLITASRNESLVAVGACPSRNAFAMREQANAPHGGLFTYPQILWIKSSF